MTMDDTSRQPVGKLAEIFSKINMSDLPAVSPNVQELISLCFDTSSTAQQLSKVILRDYSLSNKILQVVNSAYYAPVQPVTSITRAVTMLGFDAVREFATSIAIFEDFLKSGVEKEGISKLIAHSYLSAILARTLTEKKNIRVVGEEAFLCSLLHNLGKVVVCIYLPEIYRQIEKRVGEGLSEDAVVLFLLDDLSFSKVGEEVARFWNMSDKIILSMSDDPGKLEDSHDEKARLRNLAYFSNAVIGRVCGEQELEPLLAGYASMFPLQATELVAMCGKCLEESAHFSKTLRFGLNKLKFRSKLAALERKTRKRAKKPFASRPALPPAAESPKHEDIDALPVSKDKSVEDFIHQTTRALRGAFDLSGFLADVLEALYRGVGFDRVIFGVVKVTPGKKTLVGRYGLGEIDAAGVADFNYQLYSSFVMANERHALFRSVEECRDMIVSPNSAEAFPESLKALVRDRQIYLFPICLEKKTIALVYLDRKAQRPLLDEGQVRAVRIFRDFAIIALQELRRGKKGARF